MMERAAIILALVLVGALVAEIIWSRRSGRRVFHLRESLSNLSIHAVGMLLKPAATAWTLLVLTMFEPLQVARIPETLAGFVVTFVAADFAFYWYHRLSHEVPVLWTLHHTHHSSQWMNLTTAVRLNWVAKFVSPLFYVPLVLIGFPALYVSASLALGLLLQFFLHTESIGKLGWFEGKLLNTPSAHRVHHGSNPKYIDKNYSATLIVWDRLFGTYQAEEEPVRYGVTTGFVGHNPLVIQFRPMLRFLRGDWRREKQIVADRSVARS